MDANMQLALVMVIAVVLSTECNEKDPDWFFLTGPSGCGKTLILSSLAKSQRCVYRSNVTSEAMVSGYQTTSGADPSLLPKLIGRTFILKDWTEILGNNFAKQEALFGLLRGAFDGSVERSYGNALSRNYQKSLFTLLAGCTDVIHGNERGSLGERFLKLRMNPSDPISRVKAAIQPKDSKTEQTASARIQNAVVEFLGQDFSVSSLPNLVGPQEDRLANLAQLSACLRAQVSYNERGEPSYDPQAEIAGRLGRQLLRLTRILAYILNESRSTKAPTITKHIWTMLERLAMDSATGWSRDIIWAIASFHPRSATRSNIAGLLRIPATTLQRRLDDQILLGNVERTIAKSENGKRGRPSYAYKLSEMLLSYWKASTLLIRKPYAPEVYPLKQEKQTKPAQKRKPKRRPKRKPESQAPKRRRTAKKP